MRDSSRDSLLLLATLSRAEGDPVKVRIRNLSAGGMMADCPVKLARGLAVKLAIRGVGKIAGNVAWCRGGRIGVSFDQEIDPLAARKPIGQRKRKKGLGPVEQA